MKSLVHRQLIFCDVVQYLAMQCDKVKSCSHLLRSIDVSQAISWIKNSWDSVKPDTISKCFRMRGFSEKDDKGLCREIFGVELSECMGMKDEDVIDYQGYSNEIFGVSVKDSIAIENDLYVCEHMERNWNENACDILNELDEGENLEEEDDIVERNEEPLTFSKA